jgi:hypothetical protein
MKTGSGCSPSWLRDALPGSVKMTAYRVTGGATGRRLRRGNVLVVLLSRERCARGRPELSVDSRFFHLLFAIPQHTTSLESS